MAEEKNPNVATNMGDDLVSGKQLVRLRAAATRLRVNAEKVCLARMGCVPECLSRRAASQLITHLEETERSGRAMNARVA